MNKCQNNSESYLKKQKQKINLRQNKKNTAFQQQHAY